MITSKKENFQYFIHITVAKYKSNRLVKRTYYITKNNFTTKTYTSYSEKILYKILIKMQC